MLSKDNIYLNCQYLSQDETINGLIDALHLSNEINISIKQREAIRSTALKEGYAFPHCRSEHLTNIKIAIATFEKPIMWGDTPVRIVILLCSSNNAAHYIKTLATMCKILNENTEKLLNAKSNDEIYELIANKTCSICD